MLDLWKSTATAQFEAALSTLGACIRQCPNDAWPAPVVNMTFAQVAFHTLFFTDCYLSANTDDMLAQPFHKQHADYFRDYEEMKDQAQTLHYEREPTLVYLNFCLDKAASVISGETEDDLRGPSGFDWLRFPRAEVHLYNTRHIQHHAAALVALLRRERDIDVRWVQRGRPA